MGYLAEAKDGRMVVYRPTNAERKLLQVLAEHQGMFETDADWAKAAGCHPETLRSAKKKGGFLALLRDQAIGMLWKDVPQVMNRMLGEALADSFPDRKLLLEIMGIAPSAQRGKTEVNVGVAPVVSMESILRSIREQRTNAEPVETGFRMLPEGEKSESEKNEQSAEEDLGESP